MRVWTADVCLYLSHTWHHSILWNNDIGIRPFCPHSAPSRNDCRGSGNTGLECLRDRESERERERERDRQRERERERDESRNTFSFCNVLFETHRIWNPITSFDYMLFSCSFNLHGITFIHLADVFYPKQLTNQEYDKWFIIKRWINTLYCASNAKYQTSFRIVQARTARDWLTSIKRLCELLHDFRNAAFLNYRIW